MAAGHISMRYQFQVSISQLKLYFTLSVDVMSLCSVYKEELKCVLCSKIVGKYLCM